MKNQNIKLKRLSAGRYKYQTINGEYYISKKLNMYGEEIWVGEYHEYGECWDKVFSTSLLRDARTQIFFMEF